MLWRFLSIASVLVVLTFVVWIWTENKAPVSSTAEQGIIKDLVNLYIKDIEINALKFPEYIVVPTIDDPTYNYWSNLKKEVMEQIGWGTLIEVKELQVEFADVQVRGRVAKAQVYLTRWLDYVGTNDIIEPIELRTYYLVKISKDESVMGDYKGWVVADRK